MEEQFDIRDYKPTGKSVILRTLFVRFSSKISADRTRWWITCIFVKAARLRAEALDHVLLHGPPGLGKTTLEQHYCQ